MKHWKLRTTLLDEPAIAVCLHFTTTSFRTDCLQVYREGMSHIILHFTTSSFRTDCPSITLPASVSWRDVTQHTSFHYVIIYNGLSITLQAMYREEMSLSIFHFTTSSFITDCPSHSKPVYREGMSLSILHFTTSSFRTDCPSHFRPAYHERMSLGILHFTASPVRTDCPSHSKPVYREGMSFSTLDLFSILI